jgi:hypothetical protein
MKDRRKTMRLSPDEDRLLRHVYTQFLIPIDQYAQRPKKEAEFVGRWNDLSGRSDPAGDVIHYMKTKRKSKQWVTFDGGHQRLACPGEDLLSSEEWAALLDIYQDMNTPSDHFAHDDELADELASRFIDRAGRYVPGRELFALLMALRKRGMLPKVRSESDDDRGIGFGDIGMVG